MATRGFSKWPSKWYGDRLTRRVFLASAFAGILPAQKAEVSPADLSLLDDLAVPNELFFVREHFPPPSDLSSAGWKVSVAGKSYSFEELTAMPKKALSVTLECAENAVGGGLVSHAEWTGVSLSALLEPKKDDAFVQLSGTDGFSRTIPMAKALHPDTLIAYRMNGEKLLVNHGFPVRAIIPGWYGMDSVKWLHSVDLLSTEPASKDYFRQVKSFLTGTRATDPVRAVQVKSAFARPQEGAILSRRRFICRGVAWAGENRIQQVEISTDDGNIWQVARVEGSQRYAWSAWWFEWKIAKAGQYELVVRAKDDQGREQPAARPSDRADEYEWNLWQSIKVTVV